MEVVKQVAHAYRTDHEELEAELFRRLVELKIKHHARARDWRAFLARSLYNAANNFVRNKHLRESKMQSLEPDATEDARPALVDLLAAPEEPIDLRIDLERFYRSVVATAGRDISPAASGMGSLSRRARERQRRSQETGATAQVPRLLDRKAQATAQEPRSLMYGQKPLRPHSPLG
jgi:hypothetical protein